MKKVFTDYITINDKYSKNYLTKLERKERHELLQKWLKTEYPSLPNINEIREFIELNKTLNYTKQFYLKLLVPNVMKDLEENSIESLIFLFEKNNKEKNINTNLAHIVSEGLQYKYDEMDFINRVLEKYPENKIVLNEKYRIIKNYLEFSIHEIPYGVLNGMNGALIEDVSGMIENVKDFNNICEILNKNEDNLINDCLVLYSAWGKYLENREEYENFREFLIKNNIQY